MESLRDFVEGRFPRLAATYRHVRDLWNGMAPSRRTPLGFTFVGGASMQDGTFEATEVRLVDALLESCDVLVNVGANAGYYCCIAARDGKSVIAFEPLPENVRLLLRNTHENGYASRVEIFPIGLSDHVGIADLFGGGTGASLREGWAGTTTAQVRLVPVSTANIVLGDRLTGTRCLVIMDIEGAEYDALLGSSRMLAQTPKPVWMVEIVSTENRPAGSDFNTDFQRTFELFWSYGYEAWTAEDIPRPVDRVDVEAIVAQKKDMLGVHNYVFVDPTMRPRPLASLAAKRAEH